MNVTRSSVRWMEASTLASPDGVTMRAEITVPSFAMVTLTLVLASSLSASPGGVQAS